MKQFTLTLFILLTFAPIFLYSQTKDENLEWFQDSRMGLFIHWGVYSALAGEYNGIDLYGNQISKQVPSSSNQAGAEWILHALKIPRETYRNYAKDFTAENYKPEEIVQMAKNAGLKYIVLTAKHHEGFALFPTEATDWNVTNSAAKKDLIRPLAVAAKKAGLKFGVYFSQNVDWMNEGGMGDIPEIFGEYSYEQQKKYVETSVCPMLKALLTNYDIDILWYDMPYSAKYEDLANTIAETVNKYKKPALIINNRLSTWHDGDFGTPEQSIDEIPWTGYTNHHLWERCMTMDVSWGYTSENNTYNSWWCKENRIAEIVVETVSKGGNILINVGPDRKGNIPQQAKNNFATLSDWMSKYKEAIYGTTANPILTYNPHGWFTKKYDTNGSFTIYYHIRSAIDGINVWSKDGNVLIRGLMEKPSEIYSLFDQKAINTTLSENGLILHLPNTPIDKYLSVIALKYNHPPKQTEGLIQNSDYSFDLKAWDGHTPPGSMKAIQEDIFNVFFYWKGAFVNWQLNVKEPGRFKVLGNISAKSDGNFAMDIENKNWQGNFKSTKEGWIYETQELGEIEITAAGVHNFKISRTSDDYTFNIRSIRLERIGKSGIEDIDNDTNISITKEGKGLFRLRSKLGTNISLKVYDSIGRIITNVQNDDIDKPFSVPISGVFFVKVLSDNNITKTIKCIN